MSSELRDRAVRHRELRARDAQIGFAAENSVSRVALEASERHVAELLGSTTWRVGQAIVKRLHRIRTKVRRGK